MPATRFLSAERTAEMIAARGVGECIAGIATAIREDFLRWDDFAKSARVASHSPAGVIELMPVADAASFAFKYVNGHPGNHRLGLPTVMAFGMLAEVGTGLPLLLAELTLTTALRTAAMSALAAQHLARPESRRMALIGNGAQSEFQALAFHRLCGIREFRLYDTDPAATTRLFRNLRRLGFEVRACASTREAVRDADIVATLTADKRRAVILGPEMIEPGMHLNAVGGDCPGKTELHPAVLQRGRVFVEYAAQTRLEGEIQQMPPDFPVTELWQVLAGRANGRRTATELTVFDSVGFALEDFSALRYLLRLADDLGVCDSIALIPDQEDPKDLYGCITAAEQRWGLAA